MQSPQRISRCNAIAPNAPKKHRRTIIIQQAVLALYRDINARRLIDLCPSARAMQAALDFVASVPHLPIRNEGGGISMGGGDSDLPSGSATNGGSGPDRTH